MNKCIKGESCNQCEDLKTLKEENKKLKENLKQINASVTHIVEGDDDISLAGICEELAKIKKNSEVLND